MNYLKLASLLNAKEKKDVVIPRDYDKIILSANQMEKVEKWFEKNYDAEKGGFPLEKGVIELEVKMGIITQQTYIMFDLHTDKVHFTIYDMYGEIMIEFNSFIKGDVMKNEIIDTYDIRERMLKAEFRSKQDGLMWYTLNIFMQVSYFMMNFIDDTEVVRVRSINGVHEKNTSKGRVVKNSRKIGRKIYRFRIDNDLPKREYHAKTMAWTRRAHWRYLKDGRKVFVKQTTVKRSQDAQVEAGEYRL
ncbi:hypothetical protein [Bacillus sp. NPDC094106]|uniref:hypothetical protein n=1 Tax=Bacillus sp. NPDC094106 TaxID=3363949 RepID=UPI0037F1B7E6